MLPKILQSDIRLRTLSQLTSEEMNSVRDEINGLQIMDIDHVHESFLPWLAWWFRVDVWSDGWSTKRKRDVVKNALALYKYKGTKWAVERALDLSGFSPSLTLWHEMMPRGDRGTFKVDVAQTAEQGLSQLDYQNLVTLVESNKQGSQHWKMTVHNPPSDASLYVPAVVRSRKRVLIMNYPANQAVNSTNSMPVVVRSHKRIIISNEVNHG